MKVLLIGGGSGGHITPLLAVARELKAIDPSCELIGVCEKQAKFVDLFLQEKTLAKVYQIRAGKYRRYSGLSFWQRITDVKTFLLNIRDVFRTFAGYIEAKRLLKEVKPDILLIKGGFVGVPIGLAAAKLKVPFITHDSDSTPGLANRIISRWATLHATGMPKELYQYPAVQTVYTGIPVSNKFKKVSPSLRTAYREALGLSGCTDVVAIVGGSQGGEQLNKDMVAITDRLMQRYEHLGIVHVAGGQKESATRKAYEKALSTERRTRVVVKGFVSDPEAHTGAADIVISRASATMMAELALQALPVIIVPGRLAGGHQDKNARYFTDKQAALTVAYGDAEGLFAALDRILSDKQLRKDLGDNLFKLAKPEAAKELAEVVVRTVKGEK